VRRRLRQRHEPATGLCSLVMTTVSWGKGRRRRQPPTMWTDVDLDGSSDANRFNVIGVFVIGSSLLSLFGRDSDEMLTVTCCSRPRAMELVIR
jgi:hypothetical protein